MEQKWICSVCGLEVTAEHPPEKCPRCGSPRDAFKTEYETKQDKE